MAETRTYPHGVTSWVDTEQPDLDAARTFYSGLFGWRLADAGPPGSPYLIATLDGLDVAAIAPATDGAAGWNTYVAVDDAEATAAKVPIHGGTVTTMPTAAGPAGTWAACVDPQGAAFRLWQAGRRPGAQLANVPGSWNFSHLYTPDRTAAMAFYTPLFGWQTFDLGPDAGSMLQVPGYGDHLAATVDPDIHERQAGAPPGFADVTAGLVLTEPGTPARWQVVFSVADRDASAATAAGLGATVLETSENKWSRVAMIRDPQGAELTLSQFTPPDLG